MSDDTVSDVEADVLYDTETPYEMELRDAGDEIQLLNEFGDIVDTANAFDTPREGWPAGDAATRGTMERTDPLGPDEPWNWHTNIGVATNGTDANGRPLVATADVINSQSLDEWSLFVALEPSRAPAGARLEVGLDLTTEERRATGWPWIRVTRPVVADAAGSGGAADMDSTYAFSSRYAVDLYWLGIDTAELAPGEHLVWIVFGEGEAVLVPITVLP